MKTRFIIPALLLAVTVLIVFGCSKSEQQGNTGGKDYRQMIERARRRSSSERTRRLLDTTIRDFQHDLGRLPTNLYELVRLGYLEEIPPPPTNATYRYSPVYGRVDLVARPQNPTPGVPPSAR